MTSRESPSPIRWGVCVPTLNAGAGWQKWLATTLPALEDHPLLIIDSSSQDGTAALAREAGIKVVQIPRHAFDHGATRDWALHQLDVEVIVFLTQDALVAEPEVFSRLVSTFHDPQVGAAFGRQLPHPDASAIAAHARGFNYPVTSRCVAEQDIPRLGIKTAFLSNSFSAYRRQALIEAGGFPHGVILSEDMIAGARLLKAGWHLAYCADAMVYHSHNYTLMQEFKRYFDIGVLHRREAWLLQQLGTPEGEGARFVRSEINYLRQHAPTQLPEALLRSVMKYVGYRLGRLEKHLPRWLKTRLSMHRGFWQTP